MKSTEFASIAQRAKANGIKPSTFARRELLGGTSTILQMRLWFVERTLEELLIRRATVEDLIRRLESNVSALAAPGSPGWVRLIQPLYEENLRMHREDLERLTKDIAEKSDEAARLKQPIQPDDSS